MLSGTHDPHKAVASTLTIISVLSVTVADIRLHILSGHVDKAASGLHTLRNRAALNGDSTGAIKHHGLHCRSGLLEAGHIIIHDRGRWAATTALCCPGRPLLLWKVPGIDIIWRAKNAEAKISVSNAKYLRVMQPRCPKPTTMISCQLQCTGPYNNNKYLRVRVQCLSGPYEAGSMFPWQYPASPRASQVLPWGSGYRYQLYDGTKVRATQAPRRL